MKIKNIIEIGLLVVMLIFLIYARVQGHYNKTNVVLQYCDETKQIMEISDAKYQQIKTQFQMGNPEGINTPYGELQT